MTMSDYLRQVREKVGHDLLVLPSAAVALFDEQSLLLLGRHADGQRWVLPGGLVEPKELPADAAIREVWEETGLRVELTGILGVFGGPDLVVDYNNGDRASYVATVFRGRVIGGKLRPDGAEIMELRYFSAREIVGLKTSKWISTALPVLFANTNESVFQPPTWGNSGTDKEI
ncbi:MAG TPA: NUDIX domain-containing protein [Terriglobia bacterium]|nr:NUDIX domain-containing protein [Terriglobia bacterium]